MNATEFQTDGERQDQRTLYLRRWGWSKRNDTSATIRHTQASKGVRDVFHHVLPPPWIIVTRAKVNSHGTEKAETFGSIGQEAAGST